MGSEWSWNNAFEGPLSPQVEEAIDIDVLLDRGSVIILFNDDVNTFEHVIECLMAICEQDEIQAEQCAMIVHTKGKCDVYSGEDDDVTTRCSALLEQGLSAEVVKR